MKMVDVLLEQLRLRGLEVRYQDGDTLLLVGPKEEKKPDIIRAVKAFKPELLEKFRPRDYTSASNVHHAPPPTDESAGPENCRECNGTVWDSEETADICEMRKCPYKRR